MSNFGPTPEQIKKQDDDACGNLLEIYVQEAKQYDEELVRSWKDDMDNTLVFSGLYSAILTAFVIESYQKLQEDPADASVLLLQRISDQLVVLSNSSTTAMEPSQGEFKPTAAALACNILWFSSLILAIGCAFLATFVQQWSRQFVQKTGRLRSSTAHARLFSFLYFGLKDFKMHTVVNLIPSMLHFSLFLFLGGLIAFLQDVNAVLTYIVVGALAIVTAVYVGFTIWPIIALNSPYQTPLSPITWRVWRTLSNAVLPLARIAFKTSQFDISRAFVYAPHAIIFPLLPIVRYPHYPLRPPSIWRRIKTAGRKFSTSVSSVYSFLSALPVLPVVYKPPQDATKLRDLSDEVLAASQEPDPHRDAQSITWALSSLTNDQELLPFVEALPDVIYGPYFVIRDNNLHLIKALVETTDPQCDIILRITSLMTNASNSWFDEKHRTRCSIACPKALWFLAYMFAERRDQFDLVKASREFWFPEHLLKTLYDGSESTTGDTPGRKYAISAGVLCAFEYGITSSPAGVAISQFLKASGELEPFEFERTYRALSDYLSRAIYSDDELEGSALYHHLEVPQIHNKDPLPPGQIARLDIVIGLCLQLPKLFMSDRDQMLKFIYKRVEMDGWGSTQTIWDNCKSLRALDECYVGRDFCNAMREYVYTLPRYRSTTYSTQKIESLLLACVRKLAENSAYANDENSDTSQIALETMIAMKLVQVDAPEEGAEGSEDFEVIRQYLEQNVLRLGAESWAWDDPRYGEDATAGRVVVLATRLLKCFLASADDPAAANDILDAMEFILYNAYDLKLFNSWLDGQPLRVGEDLLLIFSNVTLELCQLWTERPSESLSRNTLDIVSWMWQVWQFLKLPQSEDLAKAAELMLSPASMDKVKECKYKEASRVPAPPEYIADFLGGFYFRDRFDFEDVPNRYKELQSDDESMHSHGLTDPSDIPNHHRGRSIMYSRGRW